MANISTEIGGELASLEADLKRLEAEYNRFFAGRLSRPPLQTRGRVEAVLKWLDRNPPSNYGERFRFQALQSRHATFTELWDRGLRAQEEGRPGPFSPQHAEPEPRRTPPEDRVVHVTSFRDPMQEMEKVRELYESLADARRAQGDQAVPFHQFAELIRTQVSTLRKKETWEIAFRVAIKDGKVVLTARALKGAPK